MYANPYSCFKHIGWKYPRGCTKHDVNHEVAHTLSWIAMRALQDNPPPVPPPNEKLSLFPNLDEWTWDDWWERGFYRNTRCRYGQVRNEDWGEEDSESEEDGESDEESSEEEGCTRVD